MTINIRKKKYSGSIHISDDKYAIESNNFLFYRTLDGAMRRFWKNGVGAVQGSHGTKGRAIQLRNVVYKKEDPEFINAIVQFFRRMFGPKDVSITNTNTELQKVKNKLIKRINTLLKVTGELKSQHQLNKAIDFINLDQAEELLRDIDD